MIWAKRIKKLPLGKDSARPQTLRRLLLLMLAIPSWSCASSQAIAQTGDPLGILLAAGDVAGCFQSTRKYTEVADQIQREIDLAGSLPVGVLALGDIAYADRNKQKKVIKGTYEKCFGKFVKLGVGTRSGSFRYQKS